MNMLMRTAAAALLALGLLTTGALANDTVLSRDDGHADTYEKLATDGHYVALAGPHWPHTFAQDLQVYGYRFGNVGQTKGTVVIWNQEPAPKPDKPPKAGDAPPPTKRAHIILTTQFPLTLAPEKAGWFTIPLPAGELPANFAVSLFTRSTDDAGVWVGLTAKGRQSFSSAGIVKTLGESSPIKTRLDGRNWLIRLGVRDSLTPQTSSTSQSLTGKNFAYLDDGSAEGFATVQKFGPLVRFSGSGRHLKRAYIYGKLDGTSWFNTDREAGVWVLNANYGIICHTQLAYRQFTDEAAWIPIDLPDVVLPDTFYVLIEPVSRPQAELLIGYDSSSTNKGSLFGTAGALQKWAIEAPEDKANWMIRVEFR